MSTGTQSDLSARKLQVEIEKLQAEVAQLKEKWWQRPAYVASLVPIVAAVCTLIGAWAAGYLSFERLRLTKEKEQLAKDVSDLSASRDLLKNEKTTLEGQRDSLEKDIDSLRQQMRPLRAKLLAVHSNIQFVVWCEDRLAQISITLKDKKTLSEDQIAELAGSLKQVQGHLENLREWMETRTKFLEELPELPGVKPKEGEAD